MVPEAGLPPAQQSLHGGLHDCQKKESALRKSEKHYENILLIFSRV